jgi:hypothetical protein
VGGAQGVTLGRDSDWARGPGGPEGEGAGGQLEVANLGGSGARLMRNGLTVGGVGGVVGGGWWWAVGGVGGVVGDQRAVGRGSAGDGLSPVGGPAGSQRAGR